MYCRYCGKELENGVRVCKYCGIPTYGPYRPAPQKTSPELEKNVNTDIGMGGDCNTLQTEPKKTYLVQGIATPNADHIPPVDNPQRYAPQPAPYKRNHNGFSIAGFVLAILSLLFMFVAVTDGESIIASMPFTVLGLTFSIIGTVKSKKLGSGKGLGIAGIVISSVSTVIWLIMFTIWIIVFMLIVISGGVGVS